MNQPTNKPADYLLGAGLLGSTDLILPCCHPQMTEGVKSKEKTAPKGRDGSQ
jgi:hypothetical protein